MSEYTFGDSDVARERLAVLAEVFAPTTTALLADLPRSFVRYVLDLGCGPGHTTALLRAAFPLAEITGFDASAAMIDEARIRVSRATFAVYDVTRPLRLPADIVFARFLLGHLPDTDAAQATWAKSLRPGNGLLVCEEPVGYLSEDPWFARYEETVTAIVAATRRDTLGRIHARPHPRTLRTGARPRARTPSARGAGGWDVLAECRAMAGPNARR